jgi:hypothetical protein
MFVLELPDSLGNRVGLTGRAVLGPEAEQEGLNIFEGVGLLDLSPDDLRGEGSDGGVEEDDGQPAAQYGFGQHINRPDRLLKVLK